MLHARSAPQRAQGSLGGGGRTGAVFVAVGRGGGGRYSGGGRRGGAVALALGALEGARPVDGTGVGGVASLAVEAEAAASSGPAPYRGGDDEALEARGASERSGATSATVSPRTANATPARGNSQPPREPRPVPGAGGVTSGRGVPSASAAPSGGGTNGLAGTTALKTGAAALASAGCPRPRSAKSTTDESTATPAPGSGWEAGRLAARRASEASENSSDTSARSAPSAAGTGAAKAEAPRPGDSAWGARFKGR